MRTIAWSALVVLAAGCWKTDDLAISYDVVPLENQHVSSPDLVVQAFEPAPPLECPDGEPAVFYAVYDETITTPVPVTILFHSGAFDYVKNPAQDDYLAGTHYAAEDRLSRSWAQTRVFSTLGMWEGDVGPSESHTGALVTALAQQEIMLLVPANCWGDIWHNHSGGRQENDYATERFYRDGLAFAGWMYRIATDEDFASDHDAGLPLQVDPDQISLVGLGDGGRAVSELLMLLADASYASHDITSVMVDSTPDDLSYYYDQPAQFADFVTGIERIFDDRVDNLAAYSLEAYLGRKNAEPPRTMAIWSDYDPVVPLGAVESLAEAVRLMAEEDDSSAAYEEIGASAHVFSNKDMPLAYDVVEFLYP